MTITVAEEVFDVRDIIRQIQAHEGIRVHIEVPDKIYFTRAYHDAFPTPLAKNVNPRILEQRIRLFLGHHLLKYGRKDQDERVHCQLRIYETQTTDQPSG